jgi:hypothetical protein
MAKSSGVSDFNALLVQNKDTFLTSRGTTSPFQKIEAPLGFYFARIVEVLLDTFEMNKKDANKKKTGFKEKVGRFRIHVSIICADDPDMPASERTRYKGHSGFIAYMLAKGDKEWMDRLMGDLYKIGIDTNQLRLTPSDIKDPETEFTLEQVAAFLTEQKACCRIKISDPEMKYINYDASADKEAIETLIGHSLDTDEEAVQYEPLAEDNGVPFDTESSSPQEGEVEVEGGDGTSEEDEITARLIEDPEHEGIWLDPVTDTRYNSDGEEVTFEKPKPKPTPKPAVSKPALSKPTAAPAAKAAPAKTPPRPGLRK